MTTFVKNIVFATAVSTKLDVSMALIFGVIWSGTKRTKTGFRATVLGWMADAPAVLTLTRWRFVCISGWEDIHHR